VRERLHEYLRGHPAGASPEELIDLVFTARGRDPEFAARFVAALLDPDPRFRLVGGRWRLADQDHLAVPLAAVRFVVVDLETTGEAPDAVGITEIGAVSVEDGRLGATFASLVNPRRPIPPFVSRLTGITDAMAAAAPPLAEVLPRFLAFAGDGVLVAHNAAFDASHLAAAHLRLLGRPFARPTVCTLRLARRLLPELRRRSLDAVAAALGLDSAGRHRALPDARIAAEALCVFLERARAQGVERLDQLLDLQGCAADGRPFVAHVPRARLADAPLAPGVYHLLGADGRLLYVGKARRLRARLASYFSNARGHSPKTLDLIRHVHDFRVIETGSELAAALLEARHIREHRPPYNRQRRHLPRVAFLKLGVRATYARLWVAERLGADRATYVGPFAGREAAERAQAVLARVFGLRTCPGRLTPSPAVTPCLAGQVGTCPAPCADRITPAAYRRGVDALLAFLDGDDAALGGLAARRDALAAAERFEAAARVQRDLRVLEDVRRRRRTLHWVVARQSFVVLLPTVDREAAQLYAVLGGRLAVEARVGAAADLLAAVSLVRERFARYQDAPLAREDLEGANILAAWLRDRGREGLLLPLDGPDALAARLDELAVTVDDLRRRGPLPAIDGL